MRHNYSEAVIRDKVSIMSPLRYPGSKRRFASYVTEALRLNDLHPKLLVEPFAGSASVALQLLNDGIVDEIALGERDELLASFWQSVFFNTDLLAKMVEKSNVTLERWIELRESPGQTVLDMAFACLYLNRTSYSGILQASAGPIGGHRQASDYKIGCRFPQERIAERIRNVGSLRDRVRFIACADWQVTIERALTETSRDDVFVYLDPPFFGAGPRLYRYAFAQHDHETLCAYLAGLDAHWLLSYDAAEPIISMYSHNGISPKNVTLLYSTAASAPREAQELVIENLELLPEATRLWRTSAEWRQAKL